MTTTPSFFSTEHGCLEFAWPGQAVFGSGSARRLPAWAAGSGLRQPLVISDAGLVKAGVVKPLLQLLRDQGLQPRLYDGVAPNPTLENVEQARMVWEAGVCDGLIAIGGGSVIDVGKVLLAMLCSDAPLERLLNEGDAALTRGVPPFAAVPTTAGTGSESTAAALVKDSAHRKLVLRSRTCRPQWVALDPELTLSAPLHVTACTGFDAVVHALGAALNRATNPVGEALALRALALGMRALPQVIAEPRSLVARSDMLLASYLAGVAMSLRGVDGIHGLCTPLESQVDVPHAHVLAVTCIPLMRFTLPAAAARYAQASRACGLAAPGMDDLQAGEALIDAVEALRCQAGLPGTLAEIGVRSAQLAAVVEQAADNASLRMNVRQPTREELMGLYRAMLPA